MSKTSLRMLKNSQKLIVCLDKDWDFQSQSEHIDSNTQNTKTFSSIPLRVVEDSQKIIVYLNGDCNFQTRSKYLEALRSSIKNISKDLIIDFERTGHFDFMFAVSLFSILRSSNLDTTFINASEKICKILETVSAILPKILQNNRLDIDTSSKNPSQNSIKNIWKILLIPLNALGKGVYNTLAKALDFFNFTGLTLYFFGQSLLHPSKIRIAPLFYHINESGFKALPVSILTAVIVGSAITLQGAIQLQSMGVPMMSIETTAKLSLREMGPFILALVIAGRSASSFTAQIGVMKITEELDAMKTMNFNVFEFLVLPRVLALVIAMPLMVFLADGFALFGGMLAIKYQLGVGFAQYIDRFYDTVSWNHFWVGIIKAPFFGWAIAMTGCFRGFEVKGDTEEVGRLTTISVVNALFWIIFINAIFSVIFTKLGI
ncbi:MlaE family lipid ABC transporter permease subunit [Helicobacter cappadocius]|uniref:MlaE family lipid ABC transporter permease subunit n=1 Tax=Helicobacter cappadocius TaxID=3063998 RepID=UPI00351E6C5E